jgi:hypothetical protein
MCERPDNSHKKRPRHDDEEKRDPLFHLLQAMSAHLDNVTPKQVQDNQLWILSVANQLQELVYPSVVTLPPVPAPAFTCDGILGDVSKLVRLPEEKQGSVLWEEGALICVIQLIGTRRYFYPDEIDLTTTTVLRLKQLMSNSNGYPVDCIDFVYRGSKLKSGGILDIILPIWQKKKDPIEDSRVSSD